MQSEQSLRNNHISFLDRWIIPGLVGLLAITLLAYTFAVPQGNRVSLVLYAFSTQDEVLTQQLLPQFEEFWERRTRMDVHFETEFGASGTLAGQINLGAPADIAILSYEETINWLKIGRKVHSTTQATLISKTPMVIVVRPGNPFGIEDFLDLARPGIELIHPDPGSSGAGVWGLLAAYGSSLLEGETAAQSADHLAAIWENVCSMAPSARATMMLFEGGVGDAMITYEQDARMALARGVPLEIVLPARTLVAHHVFAPIDANLSGREREVARALLDFMLSEAGQDIFRQYYLRGVQGENDRLPMLERPFTIQDLGSWSEVYQAIVHTLWSEGILPGLEIESIASQQGWPRD